MPTDLSMIGATLDRNGLRPSRYYVTKDDLVTMAPEAGVLPIAPARVAHKGRLQPGRMFLVNMEEGRIAADEEIKNKIAAEQPYREWIDAHMVELGKVKALPVPFHGLSLTPCKEAAEQTDRPAGRPVGDRGGDSGAKGLDQEERGPTKHLPDTEPER